MSMLVTGRVLLVVQNGGVVWMTSRLVFHVFVALAEFIRELIVDGTREGLAAARANGTRRRGYERSPPRSMAKCLLKLSVRLSRMAAPFVALARDG
jgi:DNA invertase Pin-like site-specific DNA recombinase